MTDPAVEELSVNFDDIDGKLSQPVLQDRIEEIVHEDLRYREAFRPYNATNINSSVVQMPVPTDAMEDAVTIVDEGGEFPRAQENYELKTLEFSKFGFEIPITMESVEDSQVDLVSDQVDRQAQEMDKDMNRRAFDAIDDAVTQVVSDNSNDVLTFSDLLAGRQELLSDYYDPDLLIVDIQGGHDLMDNSNFLDASEMQGEMRRSGQIGQIAGLDVVEDDSGLRPSSVSAGAPFGLLVDTNYFGYEGERTPITTEEYGEDRSQTDVYRIFARYGWLATQPDAGVFIEG